MYHDVQTQLLVNRIEAEIRESIAHRNALLGVPARRVRLPFARAEAKPLAATVEVRRQAEAGHIENLPHAA